MSYVSFSWKVCEALPKEVPPKAFFCSSLLKTSVVLGPPVGPESTIGPQGPPPEGPWGPCGRLRATRSGPRSLWAPKGPLHTAPLKHPRAPGISEFLCRFLCRLSMVNFCLMSMLLNSSTSKVKLQVSVPASHPTIALSLWLSRLSMIRTSFDILFGKLGMS